MSNFDVYSERRKGRRARGVDFDLVDSFIDDKTYSIKSRVFDYGLRAVKSFGNKVKSRYGFNLEIQETYSLQKFNEWLKQIDPKYNNRPLADNGLLYDTSFAINLDTNTFMACIVGNPLVEDNIRYMINYYETSSNEARKNNYIKIVIFGKYAKKYMIKIRDQIISTKRDTNDLVIYNVSNNKSSSKNQESFQSIITTLKPRNIDTLFYADHVKSDIIEHIDAFFNNKQLYEQRNIKFKTSILLYGEPGTGKSSLANAICVKYNLNMVLIDMNTFDKLDTNILTSCIDGDEKTYVVVLEDIDTVFALDRGEDKEEKIDKDDKKVINKLLQFLDSNNSPSNVIFIATTNHLERLDSALTRKGRIDKQVYIGPINKKVAAEMCRSFDLPDENVESILSKHGDTINQSSLQGEILDELKKLNSDAVESVDDVVEDFRGQLHEALSPMFDKESDDEDNSDEEDAEKEYDKDVDHDCHEIDSSEEDVEKEYDEDVDHDYADSDKEFDDLDGHEIDYSSEEDAEKEKECDEDVDHDYDKDEVIDIPVIDVAEDRAKRLFDGRDIIAHHQGILTNLSKENGNTDRMTINGVTYYRDNSGKWSKNEEDNIINNINTLITTIEKALNGDTVEETTTATTEVEPTKETEEN